MKGGGVVAVLAGLVVATTWSTLFAIDEKELAIVTQFGKYERSIAEPGLHFKVPFVQTVNKMERRVLGSESPPSSYLTRDKKRLVVDPITRWRIEDPHLFYTTVRDEVGAKARLDDLTNSELRRELATRDFGEIVCVPRGDVDEGFGAPTPAPSATAGALPTGAASAAPPMASALGVSAPSASAVPSAEPAPVPDAFVLAGPDTQRLASDEAEVRECGRDQVMASVTKHVQEAAAKYGIWVIDVRMKRSDLPPEVQESVYQRMKAERARVATGYRSKGEEEAQKIRADTDKQRRLILAEAYATSETLRGEGDAESIRAYAGAFGKDEEFYVFLRSLEAYEKSIDSASTVVLSTSSPLFKYLENPGGGP
ncbi:MAG: protease modulator HflC [Polyangiaceae bacterium]|nr:protease modulator HflC [Polyangiaceae bacterium]